MVKTQELALVIAEDGIFEICREDGINVANVYPAMASYESAIEEAKTWGIPASRVYWV